MATAVQVSVTLPQNGTPTNAMLKTIVSAFLEDWNAVRPDDLTVRYGEGSTCVHCFVERSKEHTTKAGTKVKAFVKLYTGEGTGVEVLQPLVPKRDAEAALTQEFGETNYGPHMLGFFKTEDGVEGRIDELLDCRTLQPKDVEDHGIRTDIARAYAVFHTLTAPYLSRNPVNAYAEAVTSGLKKYRNMDKLKTLAKEAGVDLDELIEYDFETSMRQILNRLQSIGAKEAWCIHDVQYENVLVLDSVEIGESKIALVDFEFVFWNYRAMDLGSHWFQKMFKWTDEESKILNCRPYNEEEKRHFCKVYAEQWNVVTGDDDTGEQVYAEATLGYLLGLTFDIHFMLMAMDEDENKDELDALALQKLFGEFKRHYASL